MSIYLQLVALDMRLLAQLLTLFHKCREVYQLRAFELGSGGGNERVRGGSGI